jgi:hypothetical protein
MTRIELSDGRCVYTSAPAVPHASIVGWVTVPVGATVIDTEGEQGVTTGQLWLSPYHVILIEHDR